MLYFENERTNSDVTWHNGKGIKQSPLGVKAKNRFGGLAEASLLSLAPLGQVVFLVTFVHYQCCHEVTASASDSALLQTMFSS